MGSNFDFKEYEEFVKKLQVPKVEFEVFLKQYLLEMAQRVVARAKPRTPVDTGYLRNAFSIGSQRIVQKETEAVNERTGHHLAAIDPEKSDIDSILVIGDTLEVTISNPASYASYIEYGHHSYPGRYMLTISADEVRQQMPKRFEKEFDEFIKRRGLG